MRTVLAALSLAIVIFMIAGCRPAAPKNPEPAPVAQGEPKKDPPKADAPKQEPPPEAFKKPPMRGESIVRRVNEADVMYMMKNLDLATKSFQVERNRYPNSREELESYYEKNVKINQAFMDGDVVYLWKAKKADEPDKAVLAYEAQADTSGRRIVLMANGEIKTVSDEEFKALPKVPTAK